MGMGMGLGRGWGNPCPPPWVMQAAGLAMAGKGKDAAGRPVTGHEVLPFVLSDACHFEG